MSLLLEFLKAVAVLLVCLSPIFAQIPGPGGVPGPLRSLPPGSVPPGPPKAPDPIEKLGDNLFRLGSLRVDTSKREVTLSGKVNGAMTLEFIANTKNGFKAYESAIELETNGLTFNLAMILIGLDKAHAKPSKFHFDPNPPAGDPLEVQVEWTSEGISKRVRAEELLRDIDKGEGFTRGQWVYTGSGFLDDGRYLADLDGVLIGFVHDPSSIIEWTGSNGVGRYGHIGIDPKLGLAPGTPLTVTVRAIQAGAKD